MNNAFAYSFCKLVKYILPIAKKGGWFYWQRLTGSIPLAINLNIPLIIDENLAKIYGLENYSILYKYSLDEIFNYVLNMQESIYYEYILKNVRYKREICKINEKNFLDICMGIRKPSYIDYNSS